MKDLNKGFEALANEHRRAIIYYLALKPASISQLAKFRKLSLPAIHKHIKVLDEAGLILRKKSGRTSFLALDKAGLAEVQQWLGQFHSYWGNNKESLENYIKQIEKQSAKNEE